MTSEQFIKELDEFVEVRKELRKDAKKTVLKMFHDICNERDYLKSLLRKIDDEFILEGDWDDKQVLQAEIDKVLNE